MLPIPYLIRVFLGLHYFRMSQEIFQFYRHPFLFCYLLNKCCILSGHTVLKKWEHVPLLLRRFFLSQCVWSFVARTIVTRNQGSSLPSTLVNIGMRRQSRWTSGIPSGRPFRLGSLLVLVLVQSLIRDMILGGSGNLLNSWVMTNDHIVWWSKNGNNIL